jgi:transcriptional regulator with GAF, ATPase, and Fis domain
MTLLAKYRCFPRWEDPMPDLYDSTRDLKEIAALAADPGAIDDVLTRALDSLQDLVPHDMAAVLRLEGDRLKVMAARGSLVNDRVRSHSLSLREFPSIRRALETRRPLVLQEEDHAGAEKDPYHGIVELPHGHSCMVVPLYSQDRVLGLMTFDRTVCGTYDDTTVLLADAYGQIISLAFRYSEQADLLARYRQLLDERNRVLQSELRSGSADARLEATRSPLMQQLVRQARQVALTEAPVLVLGETGTGKEVLAEAIHGWSPRAEAPFLKINCAAIPENLIESELFGHVKGAFTGAGQARPGRFLAANGGTLLLDEIGDMPPSAQSKLLRVLQEGTFEPVGSDRTVKVDVRILASTHRDLEARVAEGLFREDLFYRLNVFPLVTPPLRERREDLPLLAESILAQLAERSGRGPWALGPGALETLQAQDWPGNIRQLVNTLERATILQPAGLLDRRHFAGGLRALTPKGRHSAAAEATGKLATMREAERAHLEKALAITGGKIYGSDGAAALLDLKPTTLQSRLKKLGLKGKQN